MVGKQIDELLKELQSVIEQVMKKGEKGKNFLDKISLKDILKDISIKFVSYLAFTNKLSAKLLNFQEEKEKMLIKIQTALEEKVALQQQIIELQIQLAQKSSSPSSPNEQPNPYLQAVLKSTANKITKGSRLPIPVIPESVRHAPSEKILLFRAKEKGEIKTKREQETFRQDVREAVGEEVAKQIVVIRPTRFGGYTIVFHTEHMRDEALKAFQRNELKAGIDSQSSCIVAPRRKMAKAVCREPPEDLSPQDFLSDFYNAKNPQLHQIPANLREARIITTSTIGWIIELSSAEAAACYAQQGRIRYGYGREVKLEEFIPLQQCYKCCAFGHNADECLSKIEYCRLCGETGHTGKNCTKKEYKDQWKCVNCRLTNLAKGYNLPIEHGAAQLHKCPCALNQKMIKKEQLAAAGVFTTPFFKESLHQKSEQQIMSKGERLEKTQQNSFDTARRSRNKRRVHSKRSISGSRNASKNKNTRNTGELLSSSSSSSSSSFSSTSSSATQSSSFSSGSVKGPMLPQHYGALGRQIRIARPKSVDGWKMVRQKRDSRESVGRGREIEDQEGGTNSTTQLPLISNREDDDTCMI